MALKKMPYKRLQSLVGRHLSKKEDAKTEELLIVLKNVKPRGYLKRSELIQICKWKSSRAIRLIESNTPTLIRNTTRAAFKTKSEKQKLRLLVSLRGVSVPMASAILMLTNPKRYGVIDIRVWQLLHKMGTVTSKPKGAGFNFQNWYQFLMIIRYYANMYDVNARDVERTLFKVHRLYQNGNLYYY